MKTKLRNKMIKYFSFLLLFIFIAVTGFFTALGDGKDKIAACATENDSYKRYKCEVKKFCKEEEYGKNKTKVANLEKDFEKKMKLEEAKKLHNAHLNQIYNCGILTTQKKAYDKLDDEVNTTDTSGKLKTKIKPKLDQKKQLVEGLKSQNKCNDIDKKKATKKIVGDQSQFELCKYRYFLDYLKNKSLGEFDEKTLKGKDFLSNKQIESDIEKFKEKIKEEKENAIDDQNVANDSYSQFDDNFKQHIMLKEGIEPSFEQYATALYKALHPINQTFPYKAANAQTP